jgi:hypothetical protein
MNIEEFPHDGGATVSFPLMRASIIAVLTNHFLHDIKKIFPDL